MAHYGVKKQILGGLAGILARNTERLIFKGHLAFPVRHTVYILPPIFKTYGVPASAGRKI